MGSSVSVDDGLYFGSLFISLSFLAYSVACLFTRHMKTEFLRYRLPNLRMLTGFLQIGAAVSLMLGRLVESLSELSIGALGLLSVMMLVAIIVPIRIRDALAKILPAIFYFILCSITMFYSWPGALRF